MEDRDIIALFWSRDESAIRETAAKYGKYCYSIAYNILADGADAEETLNDTYLEAWNSIPPNKPDVLSSFIGGIARRNAIDRVRLRTAGKRGGGEITAVLDELCDVIGDGDVESEVEGRLLSDIIDRFLNSLVETERRVFMRRYWYVDSVKDISKRFGFSESRVKSMLFRTRKKLKILLEKEGLM